MLILSDFSSQAYSLEEQQDRGQQGTAQQNASLHQLLSPLVFLGPFQNHGSSNQFLVEQNIKVIVTTSPVLRSIRTFNNSQCRNRNVLMLIVDENFNISNFNGEELEMISEFQIGQCELLQEMNEKFNVNTKISVPFITSELYTTLCTVNGFLKNFKLHYPNLGILISSDLNTRDQLASILLLSYLIYIKPKSSITSLIDYLTELSPGSRISDHNITTNTYYDQVIKKFWESNYLLQEQDTKDKRNSLEPQVDEQNNALKRKRV